VLRTGTGDNGAYVTARNAPGAGTDRIEVKAGPGADASRVGEQLRSLASPFGAVVATREDWAAARYPGTSAHTRLGFVVVLGISLLYAVIAPANTLAMATGARRREVELLRLACANRRQVLGLFTPESLLAVTAGTLVGAAVAAVNLAGVRVALWLLDVDAPIAVPWDAIGGSVGVCAVVAVLTTLVSTPRQRTST
jgi:putative ABC transport system permease protein